MTSRTDKGKYEAIAAFREMFPVMSDQEAKTVEEVLDLRLAFWGELDDIDRALNWELYHGPLPSNYWKDSEDGDAVEPLEHYTWDGFEKAGTRLVWMMGQLPSEIFYDEDGCIYTTNPYEEEMYWEVDPEDEDEEPVWVGPELYSKEQVAKLILYKEVANQFF